MNEIEAKEVRQAIIYYNIRLREAERNGYSSRGEIATALKALQEQAEREKGCVWCKEDNKVFHDGTHFHMFCDYCGKRLEEHHEAD